jgi:two-component system NtrC family response regulator
MSEGDLVGVVFLRSERPMGMISPEQMAPICALLARLCRTPMEAPQTQLSGLTVEDLERERLLAALEQHEWNLARVARALGVTRPTVYARMDRLKIERKFIRAQSGYALRKKA